MNIFYLDEKPSVCAAYHNDKHVVKMILEYAQLLSTAHRVLDGDDYADTVNLYKKTHTNHPSAVWARSNRPAYAWLHKLLHQVCLQYSLRYNGKVHKTQRLVFALSAFPSNLASNGHTFTPPPQCMPDKFKVDNDPITAYRNYYKGAKAHFSTWRNGAPKWFNTETASTPTMPTSTETL